MAKNEFDPERFSTYIKNLLEERGVSMRKASLQAGLNHGAVGGFTRGRRPHRDSCLILAEYFQVDPTEMLTMAGYEPMPVVDRSLIDADAFAPEVKEFASELMAFSPSRRREIIRAMRLLLETKPLS